MQQPGVALQNAGTAAYATITNELFHQRKRQWAPCIMLNQSLDNPRITVKKVVSPDDG